MKWWFLFFLRGLAVGGPFDTQDQCVTALKEQLDAPILDQGFDNARADGFCFQAVRPER